MRFGYIRELAAAMCSQFNLTAEAVDHGQSCLPEGDQMSKLGDFLEAVYGSSDGFNTLQASIRNQRHSEFAEGARADRPVYGKRKVPAESTPEIEETRLSVWIALPGSTSQRSA
jgi:hypothetical protein